MLKSIKKFNNIFGVSSWFGSGSGASEPEKPETNTAPEKVLKQKKVKKTRQLTYQEEAYILTLISTENQTELAPAIKPIFDQGKELEVIANLELFIKNRETEIEKICQQNFAVRPRIHLFDLFSINSSFMEGQKSGKNVLKLTNLLVWSF